MVNLEYTALARSSAETFSLPFLPFSREKPLELSSRRWTIRKRFNMTGSTHSNNSNAQPSTSSIKRALWPTAGNPHRRLARLCTKTLLLVMFLSCTRSIYRQRAGMLQEEQFQGKCSMLISGFSREELMTALVIHYSAMPIFRHIYVSWANSTRPHSFLKVLHSLPDSRHVQVLFTSDSLNERFNAPLGLSTDCVFIVDDDMYVHEVTILEMYKLWHAHDAQLVGLWPRDYAIHTQGGYTYNSKPMRTYSMVLTKFLTLHRRYLHAYTNELDSSVLDHVKRYRNCEDIAMNLLVTQRTSLPPLYFRDGKKVDFGSNNGIYTRKGHMSSRDECLSKFSRILSVELIRSTKSYGRGGQVTDFTQDTFMSSDSMNCVLDSCFHKLQRCKHVFPERATGCAARIVRRSFQLCIGVRTAARIRGGSHDKLWFETMQ